MTAHPHDLRAPIPVRLDPADVRRLSALDPRRALAAIAVEWLVIGLAIGAATTVDAWPVTVLAVILVGARQHALLVIAHDAAHYRLLPHRGLNDLVGNVFLAWPTFASVEAFRHFHGEHHRFLQREGDGNRALWGTHDAHGGLVPEWRYPKTPLGLALAVLRRAAFVTGAWWALRGLLGGFLFGTPPSVRVLRIVLLVAVAAALTLGSAWPEFLLYWLLPYCTWHVGAQYVRLICEHSAVASDDPAFADTRSTLPGPLAALLVLPRNIGYHQAHHWYPSVPSYRLPELQALLELDPRFRAHARCHRSLWASLAEVARPAG